MKRKRERYRNRWLEPGMETERVEAGKKRGIRNKKKLNGGRGL